MRLIHLVALMLILAGCNAPPTVVPVCISHFIAGPEDLSQQLQSALDTVGIAGLQGNTSTKTMSCGDEIWEPIALTYFVTMPVENHDDSVVAGYLTKLLPVLGELPLGSYPEGIQVDLEFMRGSDPQNPRRLCFWLEDIKEARQSGLTGAEVLVELNSCFSPTPAADQP